MAQCEICYVDIEPSEQAYKGDECGQHACLSCFITYIESHLEMGARLLNCPACTRGHPLHLTDAATTSLIPIALQTRLRTMKLPTAPCAKKCKKGICFCGQKKQNAFETLKLFKWKRATIRFCPLCSSEIEKNGGCPSMVCRCRCTFQWPEAEQFSFTLKDVARCSTKTSVAVLATAATVTVPIALTLAVAASPIALVAAPIYLAKRPLCRVRRSFSQWRREQRAERERQRHHAALYGPGTTCAHYVQSDSTRCMFCGRTVARDERLAAAAATPDVVTPPTTTAGVPVPAFATPPLPIACDGGETREDDESEECDASESEEEDGSDSSDEGYHSEGATVVLGDESLASPQQPGKPKHCRSFSLPSLSTQVF